MTPDPRELPAPTSHRAVNRTPQMFLAVLGAAVGALTLLLMADVAFSDLTATRLLDEAPAGLAATLGSLAEVMAAVLGLSLTVVAIVVQLAAQRYSPKIADLFMRDWVNVGAFAFMVVSCIYVVLVPIFAEGSDIPDLAVAAGPVLAVVNFALLLPYFAHVFAFLQPDNIITKIELAAKRSIRKAQKERKHFEQTRHHVADSVERIADNCLAAVGQSDRGLALHSVRTLERLLCDYLGAKAKLPHGWHEVHPSYFYALSKEFYAEIVAQKTWVEAKTLMEFDHVVRKALGPMPELVSQLASSTRAIGEAALAADDSDALELVIRFFNTYIRHALNARNVRAVYNILYQYRLLSGAVMTHEPELCQRVVGHLVYYGRIANAMGLPFVTVTVAHDVRVLCEQAYDRSRDDVKPLLELFLTLDQPSEGKSEELALRGVRKAQSILGAYFIRLNEEELVRTIRRDMWEEESLRLAGIRDEILNVTDRKFWEVTDRGFNFDYVEDDLRPHVHAFFRPLLEPHAG